MKLKLGLVTLVASSLFLRYPVFARGWTDTYKAEAGLVRVDGDVVHLKEADGTIAEVSLNNLRPEDQGFVQQQLSMKADKAKANSEVGRPGSVDAPLPRKERSFDLGGGIKLELVRIPAGEFLMGSPDSDKEAFPFERSQHRVRITKPFFLGKYEVTQEQWQAVMGENPSLFKGAKNPVDSVSWDDCQRLLEKLNAKIGADAGKFQLPTEAQWEFACRAGSTTRFYFGDDGSKLGDYAWFSKNSGNMTHPVGQKKPNAWGLYDMHGNVWEWCQDRFNGNYDPKSQVDDPVDTRTKVVTPPPATGGTTIVMSFGNAHALRGGCFAFQEKNCRSAIRIFNTRTFCDIGFRVSLNPPSEK